MKRDDLIIMGMFGLMGLTIYSVLPDDAKEAIKELAKEVAMGFAEGLAKEVRKK